MKSGKGFDHPEETFVFSPKGAWAATLTGAGFSPAELKAARDRALAADDPSPFATVTAWIIRPQAWILLACAGLAASLMVIVLARRTAAKSSTPE